MLKINVQEYVVILLTFSFGRLDIISCSLLRLEFVLNLKLPIFRRVFIIFNLSGCFFGSTANLFTLDSL